MTKFEDQLYTDLMREHGSTLAGTRLHTGSRQFASRRVLLATGAGGLAIAAATGALVATVGAPASGGAPGSTGGAAAGGDGTPAYALSTHQNGTITLAVYKASGIAQANAKLHELGDNVVVVPIEAGCAALPPPAAQPGGKTFVQSQVIQGGSITVNAVGVPAGDILVVGSETTGHGTLMEAALSSPPAPSCMPLPPAAPSGSNPTFGPDSGSGHSVSSKA